MEFGDLDFSCEKSDHAGNMSDLQVASAPGLSPFELVGKAKGKRFNWHKELGQKIDSCIDLLCSKRTFSGRTITLQHFLNHMDA